MIFVNYEMTTICNQIVIQNTKYQATELFTFHTNWSNCCSIKKESILTQIKS